MQTPLKPPVRCPSNKQNIDHIRLQTTAKDKLRTLSEDVQQFVLERPKLQVSSWLNENIKRRKSFGEGGDDLLKVMANRIVLECKKKKRQAQKRDSKAEIVMLKRECEYLERENQEGPMEDGGARSKGRFPKQGDAGQQDKQPYQEIAPCKVQNNYFYSRERYSAIESKRNIIKGIKKMTINHTQTNPSLRPQKIPAALATSCEFRRPYSSSHPQSKLNLTLGNISSGLDIYNSRQIHSGFKKCRMNKRNRSARLSFIGKYGQFGTQERPSIADFGNASTFFPK